MTFGEWIVLWWGGCIVALLGGSLGSFVAHIPYPQDLVMYTPGWAMQGVSLFVKKEY